VESFLNKKLVLKIKYEQVSIELWETLQEKVSVTYF